MEKVNGLLRSSNCQLQNSLWDIKYIIGNTVSNVITIYGARWVPDLSGGHS